jgi:cytochrome c553
MLRHLADATAARDAVIAGRPQQAREALLRLAAREDAGEVSPDWVPWIDEMRATAERGAQATTLAATADAVAQLGTVCGDCHRTTHGGPKSVPGPEYDAEGRRGLQEKMARHSYAVDALWMGITGPAHEQWSNGSSALMNITAPGLVTIHGDPATTDRPPNGEGELRGEPDPRLPAQDGDINARTKVADDGATADVALDPELRALRSLGSEADQARNPSDKQRVFAQVIARCGACHARLGVQP